MRIIAGSARGLHIQAPKGRAVRPTLDRVREALFNMLRPWLKEARFLDLYAGTGANGIEALSRGAAHADFVDSAPSAIKCIQENLTRTHLDARATVRRMELPKGLSVLMKEPSYDIIFADPPYEAFDYPALINEIAGQGLLAPDGIFVVEHDSATKLSEITLQLLHTRSEKYGTTTLSFFQIQEDAS